MITATDIRKEYDYDATLGELVKKVRGCRRDPSKRKSRYNNVKVGTRVIREHRAIWMWHNCDIPDGLTIDHKDGNTHNNRIENLRLCTRAENNQNKGLEKNKKCPFKGVSIGKNGFCSSIGKDGKAHWIGVFSTAIAAAQAYDVEANRLFGEFAKTNKSMGLI